MVSHCANPTCHKHLHYLREGKVFLFSSKNASEDSNLPDRMEHFWLCGSCTNEWNLTSNAKDGVKLVKKKRSHFRASYAMASAAPAS